MILILAQECLENLEFMGVEVDRNKNDGLRSKVADISKDGSKVRVFVIPTNEELSIAIQTVELLGLDK